MVKNMEFQNYYMEQQIFISNFFELIVFWFIDLFFISPIILIAITINSKLQRYLFGIRHEFEHLYWDALKRSTSSTIFFA